ncbi:hypothetical protein Tco_1067780 [Tanacetum coccineum]|uniref:Uncharacterized protein n=1 Tax=Tanacetum coccineum TaxID=301880 RepID=A0ABQ5HFX9_9ASTR
MELKIEALQEKISWLGWGGFKLRGFLESRSSSKVEGFLVASMDDSTRPLTGPHASSSQPSPLRRCTCHEKWLPLRGFPQSTSSHHYGKPIETTNVRSHVTVLIMSIVTFCLVVRSGRVGSWIFLLDGGLTWLVVSATTSEGTGAKPGVPDEDKDITEEKVILESGDEQDSEFSDDDNDDVEKDDKDGDADDEGDDHVSDTQDTDDEDVETESDEDDIYKYKIPVRKDEVVEMKDDEVEESDKGKGKVTDAAKEEAKKTSEAKDGTKKFELPPSSSSLSVSSGFGDQFLKLSSDYSLVSTVKDSADADISSLMDIPIQHETPQTHSPSVQKILVSVIPETTNLPPIPEIVTKTLVSTAVPSPQVTHIISTVQQTPTPPITTNALTVTTVVPESNALTTVELRVAKLEKDVSELKTVDHSSKALVVLQSYVPTVVHKLIKDENAMDEGVTDTVKDHKRKHDDDEDDDDEDPPAGPNQGKKTKRRRTKECESSNKPSSTKETPKGKTPTKDFKTGKSAPAKEPVEEPIAEVIMDDAGDDVAHDDNPPQDTSEPKTKKTLNLDCNYGVLGES